MKVVFFLALFSLSFSCSSKAKRTPTTLEQKTIKSTNQDVQADFDKSLDLLRSKSFEAAVVSFEDFGKKNESDPLALVADLYRVRSELADFSQVGPTQLERLKTIANTGGADARVKWAATLYHAIALQHLGQKDEALGVLAMYPSASLSPLVLSFDQNISWVLIAEAMMRNGRFTDALYAHDAIFQSGTQVLKTFAIAKAFVAAPKLKDSDLQALSVDKESRFIRAVTGLTLIEKELAGKTKQNKEALLSFYKSFNSDLTEIGAKERGQRVLSQISEMGAPRKKIVGVVLPMTGPNKTLGNRILNSIYFGMGAFSKEKSNTTFLIRDSNLPAGKTMSEFDAKGVSLVIGPIERTRATAFAVESKRHNIPQLSLAISEFSENDTAVKYAIDAKAEVERVVEIAIKNGDQRFAVLSSATQYSKLMAVWFKEEVKAKGGSIVLEKTFDRKDKDFTKLAAVTKKARPDAIFIPETGKVVGNISAFMAHVDIWGAPITKRPDPKSSRIGVHYLGTSLWYQESLVRQSSQYVKHAIIPVWSSDLFDDEKSNFFYQNFKKELGRSPSSLDAFAFDSVKIAIELLSTSSDPEVILAALRSLEMKGVTGEIRGGKTELVNLIRLLSVKNKSFTTFE